MTIRSRIRTEWTHNDSEWRQLEVWSEQNKHIIVVNDDN